MMLLAVAVGGALGAVARYLLSGLVSATLGASLPWGTLTVNAVGSLLLGWVMGFLGDSSHPQLRLFLAAGVLGAFTTFSTFSFEAWSLIQAGRPLAAFVYLGTSLVVGIVLVAAGYAVAR